MSSNVGVYSLIAFLSFILLFSSALAQIELRVNDPKECGNLTVEWTGGSPPFGLLLSPSFKTPLNISIPDSAFSDGEGSHSFPITLEEGLSFMLTMWDSRGIDNGVNSQVLRIDASDGNECEIFDPPVDFWFQTPNALAQCRPYSFNISPAATLPTTIYGLIPLGNVIVLRTAPGQLSHQWTANIASGTQILFAMFDSTGRIGGATDILNVASSDERSCLNNNSPSSTATAPPTATSPTESESSPPPTGSSDEENSGGGGGGGGISMAAIAGTVVGAILFLAMVLTLAIFFIRRRKDNESGSFVPGSTFDRRRSRRQYHPSLDLNGDDDGNDPFTAGSQAAFFPQNNQPRTPGDYSLPEGHQPSPFVLSPLPPSSASSQYHGRNGGGSQYQIPDSPVDMQSQADTSTLSAGQRKRMASGSLSYNKPARFIMHTDLDDTETRPNEDGVIELPPQYTERRTQPSASQPSTSQQQPDPYSPPSGPSYQSSWPR
ncbi:hypothetical protein BDV98DRAFT_164057 [Pterulicium gracile]|uniref:Mid2 domain-containing protein n=1 Tax=Pterulicium gracile TaxID=1884261 RepID=A0A5C3QZJ5_9AGAR|nr:hypothetical protein BDV98DRAFT_164057 [Pterula gracilis]